MKVQEDGTKQCTKCSEFRKVEDYYLRKATGKRFSQCRFCCCREDRKYKLKNEDPNVSARRRRRLLRKHNEQKSQKPAFANHKEETK